MNLYNIYNKFTDFLDDGPSTQQQIANKLTEVKQIFRSDSVPKQDQVPRRMQQSQQQQQPQQAPRSSSFWGRLEKQWDDLKKQKSPIKEERLPSEQSERRRIFQDAPRYDIKPKQPTTITTMIPPLPISELPSFSEEINCRTLMRLQDEKTEVEEMYFKPDSQGEILNVLITKLGGKPDTEKLALLLENLTKKNNDITSQLKAKAKENYTLLQSGFVMQDSLIFRVNQCTSRVARARNALKLLRQTHSKLGIKIQQSLRVFQLYNQNKSLLEQQLMNVRKFKNQYNVVFELLKNFKNPELSLAKMMTMKDEIWRMSRETKYTSLSDLRPYIEQQFQQSLSWALTFLTQQLVQRYITESNPDQIERMCDYLLQFELSNKAVDISKQIRESLKQQLRMIVRSMGTSKREKQLRRNFKYGSLKQLNDYLWSLLQGFHLSGRSLEKIIQILASLKNSKQRQPLVLRIQMCLVKEKNNLWEYVQEKVIKCLKRTRLESPCGSEDLLRFEKLIYNLIQVGEEISSAKSQKIFAVKDYLRIIAQGITAQIILSFSVRKGNTSLAAHSTPIGFFSSIDRLTNQRLGTKSRLLQQEKLQIQETVLSIPPAESVYNKTEEYYFIVNQLAELLLFAQCAPQLDHDAFLFAIYGLEFVIYLLLRNHLKQDIQNLLQEYETLTYSNDFSKLILQHTHQCNYSQYDMLAQMVAKHLENAKQVEVQYISGSLREIIENLSLIQKVFEFIFDKFKFISDKSIYDAYIERTKRLLNQVQHFWLSKQIKFPNEIQIQSYQLLYVFNEFIHEIKKANLNSKISTEIITQIYYSQYVRQISKIVIPQVTKANKIQIITEIQKFQKSIPYRDIYLDQFILLLEIKSQDKVPIMMQCTEVPLALQMELLSREFNLQCIYNKQFFDKYNNL